MALQITRSALIGTDIEDEAGRTLVRIQNEYADLAPKILKLVEREREKQREREARQKGTMR